MANDIVKVEDTYFAYPRTKYLPKREPNLDMLKASEIKMIDSVLDRLSHMNATQISEYSHGDIPWKATPDGDKIDYETVFYRTPQYSVRKYEDEV